MKKSRAGLSPSLLVALACGIAGLALGGATTAGCSGDLDDGAPDRGNGTTGAEAGGGTSGPGEDGDGDGGSSTGDDDGAPAPPQQGLYAEYFDAYHDLLLERVEATVDHVWGAEAPGPKIGKDKFSVRWTGWLTAEKSGTYTLAIDGDDGSRLWLDDKLVINDWRGHFVERHEATIALEAGKPVAVRLEYFELDLEAQLKLSWKADGLTEEIIPTARLTTNGKASGRKGPKPPFANPVIGFDCPDPGVIGTGSADDPRYYAVCTGGSFPIRQSRDLVSWSDTGKSIIPGGKPSWAANGGRNWAPELHKVGDAFNAYYTSVNGANVLSIGAASAPAVTGPYKDRGSALLENPAGIIDATFFEDDDKSRWLLSKVDGNSRGQSTPIVLRRLTDDGLNFAPNTNFITVLTNNPNTWEGGVVEGQWVVKRDGMYYMFYSGNVYDYRYRTGVARAKNLAGPWEKRGNPILTNNAQWVGPGHGSVVRVKDTDYFVYHAWRNNGAGRNGAGRFVLVDKITWKDGWPTIANGSPSSASQPYPGEE